MQKEPQHTPGPWSLIGSKGTAIWAGDEIIAQVNGARAFHKIARANAQLMAAAPEMLDALEKARVIIDNLSEIVHKEKASGSTIKRIDAVIAKAKKGAA